MTHWAGVGRRDSGVALVTAIVLLGVFVLLGMAYIQYMVVEGERTLVKLRDLRARHTAQAGVYAAIGEIQAALNAGEKPGDFEARFPVYVSEDETGLVAHRALEGRAQIQVLDECARVNLNHVPPRVLEAILGVDLKEARQIRSALPRPDSGISEVGEDADRRWLTSIDDLVARNLVDPAVLEGLDRDVVTVYSVADQTNPSAFINVNSAPPAVMAAVLDISMSVAESVVAARPFTSLSELSAAAGKDPATFALKPPLDAPDALPKELCFQSRCFRIISRGTMEERGPDDQVRAHGASQVEAVVRFTEDNGPVILYWSESRGQIESSPTPAA